MKVIISIITLLMVALIYILDAASTIYTLKAESKNHNDVITWFNKKTPDVNPVKVNKNGIFIDQNRISPKPSAYFQSGLDDLFGTVQFTGKKDIPDLIVNWYNMGGDQIGTFSKSWLYDYPLPVFSIDPETKNLISTDIFTNVSIINPQGEIISEFSILPDYKYHSENVIYTELKNSHLVTGITEISTGKNQMAKYRTFLIIIDLEGNTLMRYNLSDWQLRAISSSSDGKYLAASLYRLDSDQNQSFHFQTTIIDDKGNMLYQIPLGFQKGIFSERNDRILLIDNKNCYVYNFLDKIQIGRYTTKEENLFLAAAFLSPSDMISLEEGRPQISSSGIDTPWIYDNIYIKTFDDKGEELSEFSLSNITLHKPVFNYDTENQTLFIGHSNGWLLYHIEF